MRVQRVHRNNDKRRWSCPPFVTPGVVVAVAVTVEEALLVGLNAAVVGLLLLLLIVLDAVLDTKELSEGTATVVESNGFLGFPTNAMQSSELNRE